jgi:hypothetical protein
MPVDPEGDGVVDDDEAPLEDEAIFLEAVVLLLSRCSSGSAAVTPLTAEAN